MADQDFDDFEGEFFCPHCKEPTSITLHRIDGKYTAEIPLVCTKCWDDVPRGGWLLVSGNGIPVSGMTALIAEGDLENFA